MKDLPDDQWKKKLTPEQYAVMREKRQEAPFTGEFLHNKESGTYVCAACGVELFKSDHKYDTRSGWPSFNDVAKSDAVELRDDDSFGMQRVEVVCANCGGHLGHLFDDASQTTGKYYCINSVCLDFKPKQS